MSDDADESAGKSGASKKGGKAEGVKFDSEMSSRSSYSTENHGPHPSCEIDEGDMINHFHDLENASYPQSLTALAELYVNHLQDHMMTQIKDMGGVRKISKQLLTTVKQKHRKDRVHLGIYESQHENMADIFNILEVRREIFGSNIIEADPPKTFCEILYDTVMEDLMVQILIFCGIISIPIGLLEKPYADYGMEGCIDGIAILITVLLVLGTGSYVDWAKEQEFVKLQEENDKESCEVYRDGHTCNIPVSEIVVGDLMKVSIGDVVAADALLVARHGKLKCSEANLTGESDAVVKDRKHPLLLKGTQVVEGTGNVMIIGVGSNSYYGGLLSDLGERDEEEQTDLEERLDTLAIQIGYLGMAAGFIVFEIEVIRTLNKIGYGDDLPLIGFGTTVGCFLLFTLLGCICGCVIDAIEGIDDNKSRKFTVWCNGMVLLLSVLSGFLAINIYMFFHWDNHYLEFFILGVTIVVVAVPEGLPLAVTLSLSFSMRAMMEDNNFVRTLSSCEIMGNASTICTDKTGTLTKNEMKVVEFIAPGAPAMKLNHNGSFNTELNEEWKEFLISILCFMTCSEIKQDSTKEDMHCIGGNATDQAVMKWACQLSNKDIPEDIPINVRHLPENLIAFPFNSKIKVSGAMACGYEVSLCNKVFQDSLLIMGAAERILHMSKFMMDPKTEEVTEMTPEKMEAIEEELRLAASKALRCIGICYREVPDVKTIDNGEIDEDWASDMFTEQVGEFTFVGIMCLQDPCRPEVPDAIKACKKAGITVRMITGDHLLTAIQIAKDCQILGEEDDLISLEGKDVNEIIKNFRILDHYQKRSTELRELLDKQPLYDVMEKVSNIVEIPDDKLDQLVEGMEVMKKLRVIARATPKHKDRIVQWYMNYASDVVAVTGDGANDALALSRANVGLAMGISGTQIAKEACDIVILDDNFKSIVMSVMWGRSVFDNIRKFVQFQLTVNVVALSISVIAAAAGTELPFYAVQFLWLNLVMDTFGALALATEHPTEDLLDRHPYPKSESLLSRNMLGFIGMHSMFQLSILLVLLFIDLEDILDAPKDPDKDESIVQTFTFNVFVWFQIFNQLNARRVNGEWNVLHNLAGSHLFISLTILIIIIQVLMVQLNPFSFFKTKKLDLKTYMMCVGIAAFELLLGPLVPTLGSIAGACIERLFYGCATYIVAPPSRMYIETFYENAEEIFEAEDEEAFGGSYTVEYSVMMAKEVARAEALSVDSMNEMGESGYDAKMKDAGFEDESLSDSSSKGYGSKKVENRDSSSKSQEAVKSESKSKSTDSSSKSSETIDQEKAKD